MKPMYRSSESQRRRMQEDDEGGYPQRYSTESSTLQAPPLRSNPLGNGIFGAIRRCSFGHRLREYAPSAAPRFAAKMRVAIGTAISSEAPQC